MAELAKRNGSRAQRRETELNGTATTEFGVRCSNQLSYTPAEPSSAQLLSLLDGC
jgi:hypothetical protein